MKQERREEKMGTLRVRETVRERGLNLKLKSMCIPNFVWRER